MRYIWILLLLGCIPNVNLFEVHSNWSQQEVQGVLNRDIWKGMTYEQMACSLGLMAYQGRHVHLDHYSYSTTPSGIVMSFQVNRWCYYTGYFDKSGRLQIFYGF